MKKREKQKTEQILFRLDPERAEKVRDWAHNHHIKVQAMVEVALRELMDAGMPVIDGQKRLYARTKKTVPNETELAYTLHNVEYREWVDWVILVLNNPISVRAADSLADNIAGFLSALARRKDRMIKAGRLDGADPNVPDYAAAAEAALDALEQLRRLLERRSKRR